MLKMIRNLLSLGGKPAKERRRTPSAGSCPPIGASLVKRNVVMKVTESVPADFWDWLVLSGWREVRMSKNRRKYVPAPSGAFRRLAHAVARDRDSLYQEILGPLTTSK